MTRSNSSWIMSFILSAFSGRLCFRRHRFYPFRHWCGPIWPTTFFQWELNSNKFIGFNIPPFSCRTNPLITGRLFSKKMGRGPTWPTLAPKRVNRVPEVPMYHIPPITCSTTPPIPPTSGCQTLGEAWPVGRIPGNLALFFSAFPSSSHSWAPFSVTVKKLVVTKKKKNNSKNKNN